MNDGRGHRGAIEVAMNAARAAKPAVVPEPEAVAQATAVVATPPMNENCVAAQCPPLVRAAPRPAVAAPRAAPHPSAAIRPAVAATRAGLPDAPASRERRLESRERSRVSSACVSQRRVRSRERRPRPRRPRHPSSGRRRRSRSKRSCSRRSRSSISRRPRRASASVERGALTLRPRARISYCRRNYR